jgi:hypothetical protein
MKMCTLELPRGRDAPGGTSERQVCGLISMASLAWDNKYARYSLGADTFTR